MNFIPTNIIDLKVIEPNVFEDDRGYFFESYSKSKEQNAGLEYNWVQDNESFSSKGVLRGLHYQTGIHSQAKLVRVIQGSVQDIVVDLRKNSQSFGQHFSIILSAKNKKQLLIPRGFAHGFLVLSDTAIFSYKCDNFYNKESEGSLIYNDPQINIPWEDINTDFIISDKDQIAPSLGKHKPMNL